MRRTKRIRLGTAISILTFHDPRRIAESYAMVDMMSEGRLVFGVGSGYLAHEFVGFGESHLHRAIPGRRPPAAPPAST